MRIGVFGATGIIGARVVREAHRRDHRVTAFSRDETRFPVNVGDARWRVANWLDPDSVADAIDGLDVVVSAVNAGHGIDDTIANAHNFVIGARAMVRALEHHPKVRLIAVGGGGSLEVSPGVQRVDTGEDFTRILTDVMGVPAEYRRVAMALGEALDVYRVSNRKWTYLSPSSGRIDPGIRTGTYRTGGDQVLPGDVDISAEDLAVALIDEAEQERYLQRRFTVAAA